MRGMRPRILINDDHRLIEELCKRLLEAEFEVVGTGGDGRALGGTPGSSPEIGHYAGIFLSVSCQLRSLERALRPRVFS